MKGQYLDLRHLHIRSNDGHLTFLRLSLTDADDGEFSITHGGYCLLDIVHLFELLLFWLGQLLAGHWLWVIVQY